MTAPIWQYVVMMAFFVLGFILNVVGIALRSHMEKEDPKVFVIDNKPLSTASLMFKTLLGLFAAYLSYSLYVWAPGTLSLGIVIVHWTSVMAGYIMAIVNAGKSKEATHGQQVFAIFYTLGMVVALITYGIQCL